MAGIKIPDLLKESTEGIINPKEREEEPFKTARDELSFQEEKWFYRVRVFFLMFASVSAALIVFSFLWNFSAPLKFRWLSESELGNIKELALTIIVGLVMSSTTTYFFKKK